MVQMNRIIILLTTFLTILCIVFPLTVSADSVAVETIGIGAGGAFFAPLINPSDNTNYIAFSDMGGIFHSEDSGTTWKRTETTTPLFHACFSDSGVLFAGGYGVYRSSDGGDTIEMIYPKKDDVQSIITSEDRSDRIYATNYNAEYTVCMCTYANRIYFITVDGTGNRTVSLRSCSADGAEVQTVTLDNTEIVNMASYDSDLYIHCTTDMNITAYPLDLNFEMAANDLGICFTDGKDVYFYDFDAGSLSLVYTGIGNIVDLSFIGDHFYILDDQEERTEILYTSDFKSFDNLTDKIDLSNGHVIYGTTYYYDWHFTMICGNSDHSIFLAFSSILERDTPVAIGGVIQYDGASFHWVFDDLHYNYNAFPDIVKGFWDFSQFLGICSDPQDDTHCLVTSITTIYDLFYGDNIHTAQNLRCKDFYLDEVQYYTTTGLDCQTTYFVREDPFDSDHLLLCVTDTGLHISYDGGESFRLFENNGFVGKTYENNCYDAYFDPRHQGIVYGLWSSVSDLPYSPSLNATAEGYFAVSYDGGVTWDTSYSTGIPENSIPVKMSVQDNGDRLTIAVATFNNGFYISYDSGKTFEAVNTGMETYNGMIWGEDVILTDNTLYCLTAYHTFDKLTPSALYQVDLLSNETVRLDLGDIINARSLTYAPDQGLYINVGPYLRYGWREDIQDSYYYYDDCGGIYRYDNDECTQILSAESGIFHSAFTSDGTMYAAGRMGTIYVKEAGTDSFHVFADGLFNHLKNVCFSLDEKTLYITTFGGGTYRMPTLSIDSAETTPQYTVTFCNYDGTVLSTQTVAEGMSAILPETPERASDENYHYIFSRWSESTQVVDCDLTVYACYVYKSHTFALQHVADATCVEDGYTGDNACTACGYVMATGDVLPALGHVAGMVFANDDATHTVICSTCGGDMETLPCHDENGDGYCDVCGYAFPTYYSVTFMDWDGTVLSMQTVLEGESAILLENPTREPDESGSYTFAYWDTDVTDVQCDLVVTAVYTMVEHIAELRDAYEATCTAEGYTGDTYCSLCGMLLENGELLPMTAHVESNATTNHDGTHTVFCTVCGVEMHIESCADDDGDGYCDACGYAIAVTKFTKASQFTNGGQYLIVGSGYALRSTLSTEQVSLTYDEGTYYTVDEIPDNMLWTYNNGYLYTRYNGKSYYLTVQRGWGWNASYTLSVTTNSWMTSTWSYSGSALSTRTNEGFWQSSRYLTISGSGANLSTRSTVIDLYRLDN